MLKTKRTLSRFVAGIAMFAMMSQTLFAATWYVNDNGDDESVTCVAGSTVERCTFREALVDYVAGDTIQFVTEGIDPVNRIITTDLLGAAYLIQRPVTVDGTGWSIDGNNTQSGSALVQIRHTVVDSVISLSGLSIYNSGGDGVSVYVQEGGSAAGTTLDGLKVGVKVDGLTVDANGDAGINVRAANTTIQDSVIAGNTDQGIVIGGVAGVNPSNFTISGNKIGVGTDGETVRANGTEDIKISGDVNFDMGESLIDGNTISGNGGISVAGNAANNFSGNLTIQNNNIGVSDLGVSTNTGAGAAPNVSLVQISTGDDISITGNEIGYSDGDGVYITDVESVVVQDNEVRDSGQHGIAISAIEGSIVVSDNVVRGNVQSGVSIVPSATTPSITVQGNKIGTLDDGLTADGNGIRGLDISGASSASVLIGGATADLGNVIAASGATSFGIYIDLLKDAVIQIMGNYIGVGIDGMTTEGLANSGGISIVGGTVTIGGDNDLKISLDDEIRSDELREGNVISNNGEEGRGIQIYPGEDNLGDVGIFGNIIGLIKDAVTGLYSVSAGQGIGITFEPDPEDGGDIENITIGGTVATDGAVTALSQRNIIAGNTEAGIDLNDDIVLGDGKAVVIKNNYIGTDISGTLAVGNGVGIAINAPIEVTIGGDDEVAESDRNVISGNGSYGVGVYRGIANIFNNYIGVDATGENALGNGDTPLYGLFAAGVLGGTFFTASPVLTLVSNVISGNYGAGVWIAGTDNADISENYIGTNSDGTSEIPNVASGEFLLSYLSSATAIDGSGIVVSDVSVPVDWDNLEGEWVAYTSNGTKIYDNVISGNEGSGVAVVHLDDTTELGWGPAGGGLDFTSGYIKNNIVGFASDGETIMSNGQYGIYVEDVVNGTYPNIINLLIGDDVADVNIIETSETYGIYLKEVEDSAVSGGYVWLTDYNTFSNPILAWIASIAGKIYLYGTAFVPGVATVESPTVSTLSLSPDYNDNLSTVTFAIQDVASEKYVQEDGSLDDSEVWQSEETWGESVSLTGLSANTSYTFKVKGKSGADVETEFSEASTAIYTLANPPSGASATVSGNDIVVSWSANGNSAGTEYSVSGGSSSGWITATTYTHSAPTCGSAQTYTVKARNGALTETTSVSTGSATVACPVSGGGVILNIPSPKPVVPVVPVVPVEPVDPVVPVVPEPEPDPDPIDPEPVDPVVSDPVDPQHLVATTDPAQENGATQDTTVATDTTTTTDTATTTDTTTTTDATPYTDILLGSINMLAESMTTANLANVAEVAGISTEIATTTTDWSYDSNGDGIADIIALASGVDPLASGEEIIQSLFGATEDYADNLPVVTAGTLRGATTVMSSAGGVLPGKYKPNQKVSVEIRNARGDVIDTIDSFTDNDGKFLAPLGSLISKGVKTGDEITLVVKSEKSGEGNTMVVKIGKTEDAPKISSTGPGVERISENADYDEVETHVWNDVLSERLITLFIKGSEFESYFIAVLNKMKEEQGNTRIFTGTAKPGTRVAFMFESLITTSVVIADARGNFSISAPKGLEEGIHRYTGFVTNLKESSVSPAVTGVLRFINPSRIIDDILLKIEG